MNDGKREHQPKGRRTTKPVASKAPAISRAVAILRLLGDRPLGVQSIARELGLVPSTCLHVLRALASEGLVSVDPITKVYSLEAGILALAQRWFTRNRFVTLAQPLLDQISREFNVTTVGLRIFGDEESIVVALSQWHTSIQLSTQIGSRFPAFAGATGRCLAAFGDYSEAELRGHFKTQHWDNKLTFGKWKLQVAETRAQGFSIDEGNYISGATVILAPVWEAGSNLNHAVLAFGISDALKRTRPALEVAVLTASRTLSNQLSGEAEVSHGKML